MAASEFTGLFDSYKINCVVVKFSPDYNVGTAATGGAIGTFPTSIPQIHVAWDYNDSTVSTAAQLSEYGNYRCLRFYKPRSFKVYPRVANMTYLTGATFGYGPAQRAVWMDANYPAVPHFGFKFAVENVTSTQIVNFKIRVIYYLSLKATK